MYCEWPEFRRCCLCLPLRRGILVFAYINVILIILQILALILLEGSDSSLMLLRNVAVELPAIFTLVLCVLEVVFHVLLIYGTHTRKPLFIKIYYYFMISMLLASAILEVLDASMSRYPGMVIYFILCLIINLYLLFLVRSLVRKLEVSDGHKYSNQLADFIDGTPARDDRIYPDIVVPKDCNNV